MPGTSGGTGQPLWFKCSNCRKHKGIVFDDGQGRVGRVKLTGRTKRLNPSSNVRSSRRVGLLAVEYVCGDCGWTGWSRHRDLLEKFKRVFDPKRED